MVHSNVHRFLLRSVASRGVVSIPESLRALAQFTESEHDSIQDLIKEINETIRPYQQTIKLTTDELTNEEVLIFLSLGYDDATKAQNFFSANELEFFRLLIEQIMTTESRQVTRIHALNIVGSMKSSLTKTDAEIYLGNIVGGIRSTDLMPPTKIRIREGLSVFRRWYAKKLLKTWCRMRYLDKDGSNYALGVRAIHEFEGYLRQNMPDVIEECCLCKQIVFRGYNCPACAMAVHTRCLNRYLEKVEKWPCCKTDYSAEQLEQMNSSDSSRLLQSQRVETVPTLAAQNSADEVTVHEATENVELTQELIPEISQRITRKRKRQIE